MTLLLWLAALPLRFLAALGLRRAIILVCLFTLAVTLYGVAEDLGPLEPPAQAAPAPADRPPASRGRAAPRSLTFPPATCGCTAQRARPTGSPGPC
jgi:hypothetical protein